jgi:hypothetical protein
MELVSHMQWIDFGNYILEGIIKNLIISLEWQLKVDSQK